MADDIRWEEEIMFYFEDENGSLPQITTPRGYCKQKWDLDSRLISREVFERLYSASEFERVVLITAIKNAPPPVPLRKRIFDKLKKMI